MIHDGRNLDTHVAELRGEGAELEVREVDVAPPAHDFSTADTYYDLPVVKAAPWKAYVPAYFYLGGLAGAAATLAAFTRDRALARRLHWLSAVGEAAGGALLVADLGRPARFHHMMRVVRPRSPMNVGTWILSASGASSGLAVLGVRAAEKLGAVTGAMLSTYTGVLVGNTAIPIWARTRNVIPLFFAATSAASLAAVLELFDRAPRRYALAAKAAECGTMLAVSRRAKHARVEGALDWTWRAARWLGVASFAATALRRPRLGGVLGTIAAVLGRFAMVQAGRASANDPRPSLRPAP